MRFWMNFWSPVIYVPSPCTPPKHVCYIGSISGLMNVFNKHSGSMAVMKVMEDPGNAAAARG